MARLGLFEGFGVELEYMIVNRTTLDVMPIADVLLRDENGSVVSELDCGTIAWCNELVAHVIELKTNGPARQLTGLDDLFSQQVNRINELLAPHNACLLPTAMHPWMNPWKETVLWEHEYNEIYATFNRIFDCRGHGWSNLQSTHLNLPFANDDEFGRLHAAIRAILPILPVLAASSPIMDSKLTGVDDNRLEVYKSNAKAVPLVSGHVVPEPVFTKEDYEKKLLASLYRAIAPHDPEGILQEEWLNARGAIARFDRNAIEIRVLDIQECPAMDIAILDAIRVVLHYLVSCDEEVQSKLRLLKTEDLAHTLGRSIADGGDAALENSGLVNAMGIELHADGNGKQAWIALLKRAAQHGHVMDPSSYQRVRFILENGNLSQRIVQTIIGSDKAITLHELYNQLASCLNTNTTFIPETSR
jgi:gamma-glutamyl:cysteine ligase YbdK (ATP-grasp superfamily)